MTQFLDTPVDKSLSATGAWTDIDVSGDVPASATGAIFRVYAASTGEFGLRKNGSTDDRHKDLSSGDQQFAIIGLDANRICEGYIELASTDFYLVGYTEADATFFTNAADKSIATTTTWTDIDLSGDIAAGSVAAIFEVVNISSTQAREFGLRKNGSTDDRHADLERKEHNFAIVGVDANRICEGYIETTDADFYLLGYLTMGQAETNAHDRSLGTTGSYVDIDESANAPANATGVFGELIRTDLPGYHFAARKNGTSFDYYADSSKHGYFMAGLDASDLWEGKIENVDLDFYTMGYFVVGLEEKTKESSVGLKVISAETKESSISLSVAGASTKESSIGISVRDTFEKESSIGLRVVTSRTKESSIGLRVVTSRTKESSIGISVEIESEVVSIIGMTTVTRKTKESTLGMTIEGSVTKESSISLSVAAASTKESSIGISVRDTFEKESSIGLRVVTSRTKESSISLSIWDTMIKESSIGIQVLVYLVKESTIGMCVKGPNTKESSIGITIAESVLKKGFYYAKLGNIVLEGVEEDNFRISKEINQIPSFNYEIANCADNRTTITDNLTEEFKIYWRHHGVDTHIFTGIINADGIEYISLDSIEITGYASYVVLSWPLLKHLAAADAEPVNKLFDFNGTYTDYTTEANNATINDVVLSLSNGNHGLYIGENQPFWGAQIKYSTKGIQAEGCSIVLEYSKGGGVWGALDALDESDAFTEEPGTYNLIIPHPPSDWGRNIVDGINRYWVRWRLTAGAYSTPPKLDQIYIVNVDIYRTYYFDTSAREILLNVLEGTEYTMDVTDSCPEDDISLIAEYESPLRVIAAIPNALTWTDTDGSKKAYQWWIDDAKKVHMKNRRGTTQPDDITGDMTIFNNQEDYFHLSNRLIGLGPRDGLGQMRAIIEDKTSIGTHTLREIAVTKEQILKYDMLKTSLEKDITISKNPMQRIRGKVTTEFWGLRGYEVGDTVTLHQGKWNVAEKAFQIVKAEIGPNMTTIDLGISQDHLNGLRDSLQRQLTLNNVRMHGSTTVFEAGPETMNYQRKSDTEVYSAKLNVEIPTDVKKIHKVHVSWTFGPYRASVNEHTTPLPPHDHDGWAGGGGGIDSDFVGLGGAFTPDVSLDGDFTPQTLSKAHKHYVDDTLEIEYSAHQRFMLDFPDNGKVFGGNHRHTKGRTDGPDDTKEAVTAVYAGSACVSGWCVTNAPKSYFALGSHYHLNSGRYTGDTNPTMHVNGTTEYVVYEVNPYVQHTLSENESPAHDHDGVYEDPHDHAGIYQDAHNDHSIPLEPPHSDHAIVADAGGELDITYGIHEEPGGTTMMLLVNGEEVGEYTTAQSEIRIDGWLTSGNNVVELRPVVGENKKGGATIKGHGLLFVEPKRF